MFPVGYIQGAVHSLVTARDEEKTGLAGENVAWIQEEGYRGGCVHGAHLYDKQHNKYGVVVEIDAFATADGAATAMGTWSNPGWYRKPYAAQQIAPNPGYTRGVGYTFTGTNKETDMVDYVRQNNIVVTVDAYKEEVANMSVAPSLRPQLNALTKAALTYIKRPAVIAIASSRTPLAPVVHDGANTKWQITLVRTYHTHVIGSTHAQGKFVVAVLKVQNIGNTPQSFSSDTTLTATDAGGRTFSENTTVESDAASQLGVTTGKSYDVALASNGVVVLRLGRLALD